MGRIVSGIYCNVAKLKAVNKQAVGSLCYAGRKELAEKRAAQLAKEKKAEAKRKKKERELLAHAQRRLEKAERKKCRCFLARSLEEVKAELGLFSDVKITGVAYRKPNGAECELGLRAGDVWYSLRQLVDVGFIETEWGAYAGLQSEDVCKIARVKLQLKFGVRVPEVARQRSSEAQLNLAKQNLPGVYAS